MCGICGVLSRAPDQLAAIRTMNAVLDHRGPDGRGYLLVGDAARFSASPDLDPIAGDRLALAHRRLSILDLTSAGAQPMASADGRDWISYNGEVYNYLELRDELASLGHAFHTGTDTEVILAAYREWGSDCFARFNGMWALALWDGARERLLLSRDRFGIKPLYHTALPGGGFAFASEIKALLAAGASPTLDEEIATDFLKWSLTDHTERTFFSGIQALPPGHWMTVEAGRPSTPVAFWRLGGAADDDAALAPAQAATRFRELLGDAVRLRLRSDVPVGSCLSGGLDSSSIVCLAAEAAPSTGHAFHTFTAASDDPALDESDWARRVSAHTGSAEHRVVPDAGGFATDLERLLWHQEQPFTTSSIYAQWCIMREARTRGIPVLLDGQGADEVLCGYRKYYFFYLRELVHRRRFLHAASEGFALLRHGDRGIFKLRDATRYLPAALRGAVPDLGDFVGPDRRGSWQSAHAALGVGHEVRARQVDDLYRFSVPALLRYEDRNSMAWSIESRVPFLDYRLVDWLVNLPSRLKLSGGRTKVVMRDGMRGIVPDVVLDRRDKVGFVTAQERWMRGPLTDTISRALEDCAPGLAGMFDMPRVRREFTAWREGRSRLDHGHFFRLFVFDQWLKRFDVHA
jgi:asparagine synthase (glutamine-hydrolysing)